MELNPVRLEIPDGANIIVGQAHFIKTVEDIYEAIINTVPQMKFGIAFNEASGACLTRIDGNDEVMKAAAGRNAMLLGAGEDERAVGEGERGLAVLPAAGDGCVRLPGLASAGDRPDRGDAGVPGRTHGDAHAAMSWHAGVLPRPQADPPDAR